MKNICQIFCVTLIAFLFQNKLYAQNCSAINIQHQADIASTCNQMVMTMIHDVLGRKYLYVANKEAGLKIYDISVVASPSLVATVPVSLYDSLHVMSLSQDSNYVYLAIGNSFNTQKSGMAIVDVTNPSSPVVTDFYELPNSGGGAGIVKAEGNYAYLGTMVNGLVILDITDKNNIQFVSQFVPDVNYPPIANPDTTKINARGMQVKNSIVYLCYDAGGFRIINCTNKSAPVETGHYCNPVMYTPQNHPRAYNNVTLDDTLAYIAVDYCGMEVLNISDTGNITLAGWWNPYNCPNNNWLTSPVHANEIQIDKNCKQVFLSTGKSDMMVIDVSNPAAPDSCNFYGGVSNNIGTWGIGLYEDEIYLSYICTFGIPFASNWTGVKIVTYNSCGVGVKEEDNNDALSIFPNPSNGKFIIQMQSLPRFFGDTGYKMQDGVIEIYNVLGEKIKKLAVGNRQLANDAGISIDISSQPKGIYFLKLQTGNKFFVQKIIVQ